MGILVEVDARERGQLGRAVAELEDFFRDPIFAWEFDVKEKNALPNGRASTGGLQFVRAERVVKVGPLPVVAARKTRAL
jgi:hypothetical protein